MRPSPGPIPAFLRRARSARLAACAAAALALLASAAPAPAKQLPRKPPPQAKQQPGDAKTAARAKGSPPGKQPAKAKAKPAPAKPSARAKQPAPSEGQTARAEPSPAEPTARMDASASERRVFTGEVAGEPVVALLDLTLDRVTGGVFFYRRDGRDVALVSTAADGELQECAAADGLPVSPCESSARWTVALREGRLTGSRHAAEGGADGAIALAQRETTRPKQHTDAERSAYERLRLEDARIKTVGKGRRGTVAWRVVQEERSGVTGLVLTAAPSPRSRARIGSVLEAAFHGDVAAELSAEKSAIRNLQFVFANQRMVAVTGRTEMWEGAEPSNGFFAYTWDAATGEPIEWATRLRFVDADAPALDLTRSDLLAALVLRRALSESSGESGQDGAWCRALLAQRYGCAGERCAMRERGTAYAPVDPSHWVVYPTEEGLAVAPDAYREAERGCRGEAIVVPWAEAKQTRLGKTALP